MKKLNQSIDFSILSPFITREEVMKMLKIAIENEYFGFCVPSYFLEPIYDYFEEEGIYLGPDEEDDDDDFFDDDDDDDDEEEEEIYYPQLITVVGFPYGYQSIEAKKREVEGLEDYPPHEIDFVINLSAVRSKDWATVNDEMAAIRDSAYEIRNDMVLKAIIEAPHWDLKTLEKICFLCIANRLDYIKTSTGFLDEGITIEKKLEVVQTMLEITQGSGIKIKLSGGVRDTKTAQKAIKMGVHRIGTSAVL